VAIKAPGACKTRLRSALGDDAREALVRAMLRQVIAAASAAAGVDRLLLLAPPGRDLAGPIERIGDEGMGLNAELARLLQIAAGAGAHRLVILPADLPVLRKADVETLTALSAACVAIAPDRAGLGTNSLSLPLPAARDFRLCFGANSFARHRDEAIRLDLPCEIIRSDTLAFDVDEPADLLALAERLRGSGNPDYAGLRLALPTTARQARGARLGNRSGPATTTTTAGG
jgi:2-phospho-L-lactate guanylyltransferase